MKDKRILATFLFFIIAMVLGWLLRLYYVYPVEIIKYKYLLHAHSHVILLGWAFNALYLFISNIYVPKNSKRHHKFSYLFWCIQLTIFLAMLGFLIEGYALFSILFSTAFLLGTFIWITWLWKDVRKDKSIGGRFIFLSLIFLLISSLGPLSLGAIMTSTLKDTPAYPLSIYYYLHFLYNGFLIFGLIGVAFVFLDSKSISYNKSYAENFYRGMKWSIVPLYALSAVWLNSSYWINIIGGIAAIIQIWGGYYLYKMIGTIRMKNSRITRLLLRVCGIVLSIKFLLQFLSSIQWISDTALDTKRYLIIGYIHLIMLGLISVFILWYLISMKWIFIKNKMSQISVYIFLLGIFSSELLLFSQGFLVVFSIGIIPYYDIFLLITSSFIPIGILGLMIEQTIDKLEI